MTDKEKLEKLEKLADAMYYAAQQLTTDASRLHKAMDKYHKFIIYEYHEEKPVSDFTKALAECIHQAQCAVVDPMAHAEIWKDELIKLAKSEEPVSKEPMFKQGDILYNVSDGNKIEIIDIVADQYKFECGDEYPHYEFFGYIESNFSKCPISKDLEEAIDTYLATYFGGEKEKQDWPFLKKMAIHFANWQKEHLLAKAVDVTVHIDAGGYPHIPQIELYDYDKDIPLAKEGDKYKVILIKED